MLTSAEAIAWNKKCAEQFSLTLISSKTSVVEDMYQLESVLRNASWVIVMHSFGNLRHNYNIQTRRHCTQEVEYLLSS
jgi:hypothetical protein